MSAPANGSFAESEEDEGSLRRSGGFAQRFVTFDKSLLLVPEPGRRAADSGHAAATLAGGNNPAALLSVNSSGRIGTHSSAPNIPAR